MSYKQPKLLAGNNINIIYGTDGITISADDNSFPTAGLLMWLDANDPFNTGVQPADMSLVSEWIDKSGNGNDASFSPNGLNVNFYKNIINGLPIMANDNDTPYSQFYNLSANLNLSMTNGMSFYCVYILTGTLSLETPLIAIGTNGNTSNYLEIYPYGFISPNPVGRKLTMDNHVGGSQTFYAVTPLPVSGTPYCDSWIANAYDSNRCFIRSSGTDQSLTFLGGASAFAWPSSIGFTKNNYLANTNIASSGLNVRYGEILLFNHAHTPAESTVIESYLMTKWGF